MNNTDLDIPIFRKSYELYKTFYSFRLGVSKQDRYTIWQKCESLILEILEGILYASETWEWSVKINFLRMFIRLMKDTKSLDTKKYLILEASIDEIGRMLGGWIKATKER